jgi:hypothetical protein
MSKIWGKSFDGFKSRLGYFGESVLYLLLAWAWAKERFSDWSIVRGAFTQVNSFTIEILFALICSIRWMMGIWLRSHAIGLPKSIATFYSIGVMFLWIAFLRNSVHAFLWSLLFMVVQAPLLVFSERSGRQAGGPVIDGKEQP